MSTESLIRSTSMSAVVPRPAALKAPSGPFGAHPQQDPTEDQTEWKPLWLHVKWNQGCYAVYAEYYYEAWVTNTESADGPRENIDRIILRWRHGSVRGEEVVQNSAVVAKSDRTYASGCDDDMCLVAIATAFGSDWSSAAPQGCSYA